jgi:hypothetical protein
MLRLGVKSRECIVDYCLREMEWGDYRIRDRFLWSRLGYGYARRLRESLLEWLSGIVVGSGWWESVAATRVPWGCRFCGGRRCLGV